MQDKNICSSKTITVEGNNLHYREVGSGSTVLLLHGWGSSAESFNYLEKYLAYNFHVLSIDLPGFGRSNLPSTAWSLNDYVELVKSFMSKLGIANPAVVGHSFGGRIAICLGAQSLVSKLILANSAGVRPRRHPIYYINIYLFKLAKSLLNLCPNNLRLILLEKLQKRFGSTDYRNANLILRKTLVNVVNEDLTKLLPNIKVPTLLIWG